MRHKGGFTLIEVLVAMVILAVGLLGLAALQAKSLKNTQSSYFRSQATQLATDISDRMRANVSASDKYLSSFMQPDQATNQETKCLVTTSLCPPALMAEHDLYEWNRALKGVFGKNNSAKGEIQLDNTSGINTYTIKIEWTENRDDDKDGKLDLSSFVMEFRL